MKYDDGFVAYINGTEVARSHVNVADGVTSEFDDTGVEHLDSEAVVYEEFDITQYAGLLNFGGENILAIHALNVTPTSSDMLVLPVLNATFSNIYDENVPLFFDPPTPGAENVGGTPYVASPEFNPTCQLFTTSFNVELSVESPTGVIYYTLDGSEPSQLSAVYSAPISISDSTMVKAKAYESGIGWSKTAVQGYSKLNADVQSFNSNLPIVVLDTFGSGIVGTDDPDYTVVYSSFIDVDPGTGRASITGPADHVGMNGIRVRGHSSPSQPKNSYKFETWDENLDDKNVSLLGLPADSDWTLYGPIWDKSLIRNLISYQWSNEIGRYAAGTRLVEVFLNANIIQNTSDHNDVTMGDLGSVSPYNVTNNSLGCIYPGDYMGVYLLTDKLTRSKDRVDIEKLEPYQNAYPEVTGGYLMQYDCCHHVPDFTGSYGNWVLEEPKPWDITTTQKSWITNYLNTTYASLSNTNPVTGYRQYIDTGSYIDLFWLTELSKNSDGYAVSTFAFKDRLGKLNMGPLWDINGGFGNYTIANSWYTYNWQIDQRGGPHPDGYRTLMNDFEYKLEMWDRWFSLREQVWNTDKLMADIDYWADYLSEAQERNFQRWPVLDVNVSNANVYVVNTYEEEIEDHLKPWLVARMDWIDSQFTAPPVFNQDGGEVDSGFGLTISLPAGESGIIYYTVDGTDPREAYTGNAVGTAYAGTIILDETVSVKARYQDGSNWSALNEALFIVDPLIVINEFMADNESTIEDPDETGEFPDWIELYNKGTTTVNLAGKFLTDDLDNPNKYEIPAGITIDPGEHLVFWADEDGTQGPTHVNFKLGKGGEAVGLFDTYANGNRLLSTITFGTQTTDVSYGRYPDGTGVWGFMLTPTPWNTNSPLAP